VQPARLSDDRPIGAGLEIPAVKIETRPRVSALSSASVDKKNVQLGSVDSPGLALLKYWSIPLCVVAALLLAIVLTSQPLTPACAALVVATVLISRQIFSPFRPPSRTSAGTITRRLLRLLLECAAWTGLLLCLGLALGIGDEFQRNMMLFWFALTPVSLVVGDYYTTRALSRTRSAHERHIIIGANDIGVELARRISENPGAGTFLGFFDFRSPDRLPLQGRDRFAGQCTDVAAFVHQHAVNAIYIALPISTAPRIAELLQDLRDTTASIYFVPNLFGFDLVQPRCLEIHGIPALAVCETPHQGMSGLRKRAIDIVLAVTALLLLGPVMLATAVAVKLSSPGPVFFRQRRYGLNGEEINVYKFRSMSVCEDGAVVTQATADDQRITRVGRFLRRSFAR
jgi:putative colanic acid biosynthesis UDP-glucose lipid carrier transferase